LSITVTDSTFGASDVPLTEHVVSGRIGVVEPSELRVSPFLMAKLMVMTPPSSVNTAAVIGSHWSVFLSPVLLETAARQAVHAASCERDAGGDVGSELVGVGSGGAVHPDSVRPTTTNPSTIIRLSCLIGPPAVSNQTLSGKLLPAGSRRGLSLLAQNTGGMRHGRRKARMEGKDYVMQDGDVVEFRFNV
jgi:hypothetical protein